MAHQSPPEIAPGRAIGWSFPVHERREPSFQDLAELAASITAHPFAGISLVDVDHVWIKAGVGIEPGRLLRETSFCGHAVTSDLPVFTVPDTTAHPSFRDNPLVTGAPFIRSYGAGPLVGQDGATIGTVWVMDQEPRILTPTEGFALTALSAQVTRLLELRHRHPLTGLPTRDAFTDLLRCAMEAQRQGSEHCRVAGCRRADATQTCLSRASHTCTAVGAIRAANLHLINSLHGRRFGERLVSTVAEKLSAWVGPTNMLGHLDEQHFAFALFDPPAQARRRLDRLERLLSQQFMVDSTAAHLDCTVGVITPERTGRVEPSAATLIDSALMTAARPTADEPGRVRFARPTRADSPDPEQVRQLVLRSLPDDLLLSRLVPHYQPQVDIETGTISGYEALVRLPHPTAGLITSEPLVAAATEHNLLHELDRVMFRAVCQDIVAWREQGVALPPVSINMSPASLQLHDVVDAALTCLEECRIPGEAVMVEVTESGSADPSPTMLRHIRRLRRAGLRIALDDFGTGSANLRTLQMLPMDSLKVSRALVHGDAVVPDIGDVLRVVRDIAEMFHVRLVCEGIEEERDLAVAIALGYRHFQGWYFGGAVPAAEVPRQLSRLQRGRRLESGHLARLLDRLDPRHRSDPGHVARLLKDQLRDE